MLEFVLNSDFWSVFIPGECHGGGQEKQPENAERGGGEAG